MSGAPSLCPNNSGTGERAFASASRLAFEKACLFLARSTLPDAIFIFPDSGFSSHCHCRIPLAQLKRSIRSALVIPLCLKSLARVVQFGKSLDKDHRVGSVYKVLKTIFFHKISLGVVRVETDKPDVLLAVLFVKVTEVLMEA